MFSLAKNGVCFAREAIFVSRQWIIGSQLWIIVNPFNIGVNALYQYSRFIAQMQKLYQNNRFVKNAIDSFNYVRKYIYAKWTNIRVEPYYPQWISSCTLSCDPWQLKVTVLENNDYHIYFDQSDEVAQQSIIKGTKFPLSFGQRNESPQQLMIEGTKFPLSFGCTLSESYHCNGDWPKKCAQESYVMECAIQSESAKSGDFETLMLMKSDGLYLSRTVYCLNKHKECLPISWEPSFARFLSVEYSHPEMTSPIILEIDNGFWVEGNHLFSAAFVQRCLEYQNKPYYFDMNYKLKIMDDNINMFEMTSESYIVVDKHGYNVVRGVEIINN